MKRSLAPLVLLVLLALSPRASKAELQPPPEFHIVTNRDGLEAVRFALLTVYNTQYVFTVDLGLLPQFTVMTNVGGLLAFFSVDTNRFIGRDPTVLLTLVNAAATSTPHFPRAGAAGEPLFGYCTLSNTVTGQTSRAQRPPPPELVSVTGGDLPPCNHAHYPIRLYDVFHPKERTTYAVRFCGKIPYSEVQFETPPLVLTIEDTR